MRAMCAAVAVFAVACGTSELPPPDATTSAIASRVDPTRIDRVRKDLPDGYEVTPITGPAAPTALWGYGAQWSAEPARCAVLADPAVDSATTRGWSGSGIGGIVYAVVAESAVHLDPAVTAECGQWSISGGRASGSVTLTAAPEIADADTVATTTATTTVVEGGTETHSHADTVTAYTDDHVVFVAVVTDPGSPDPQLGADFARALLVKTVAALRG